MPVELQNVTTKLKKSLEAQFVQKSPEGEMRGTLFFSLPQKRMKLVSANAQILITSTEMRVLTPASPPFPAQFVKKKHDASSPLLFFNHILAGSFPKELFGAFKKQDSEHFSVALVQPGSQNVFITLEKKFIHEVRIGDVSMQISQVKSGPVPDLDLVAPPGAELVDDLPK